MMSVRVRLLGMLARWLIVERRRPHETVSRLRMRCSWLDCDINRHMNNSRYLALMDIGRYHFLLRSDLARLMWERRWAPVLVHAELDFRRSLRPGDRFMLETHLSDVGRTSATLTQRFYLDGALVAEGRVVALFLKGGVPQALGPVMGEMVRLAGPAVT